MSQGDARRRANSSRPPRLDCGNSGRVTRVNSRTPHLCKLAQKYQLGRGDHTLLDYCPQKRKPRSALIDARHSSDEWDLPTALLPLIRTN
ncbi:hypothetical protein J6590_022574 [Homalodisca vitripennis]|nr:hypothetical protein J6590_022574 [Homalodisca vitripennis]